MNNVNKAFSAKIVFCQGLEVDGYKVPSGEYRTGVTSVSVALGYQKQWATELLSKSSNRLKSLKGKGFQGKVEIYRTVTAKE